MDKNKSLYKLYEQNEGCVHPSPREIPKQSVEFFVKLYRSEWAEVDILAEHGHSSLAELYNIQAPGIDGLLGEDF